MSAPTGSDTPMASKGLGVSGSYSNPNLTKIDNLDSSMRKRKQPDDEGFITAQLQEIKQQMSDMMSLLSSSITFQNERTDKVIEDISTIKDQMADIKTGMSMFEKQIASITTEQKTIQSEFKKLTSFTQATDNKIKSLESELKILKSQPPSGAKAPSYDDIIVELNERTWRSKNILISGIPEPNNSNPEKRRACNKDEVLKIARRIYPECPSPVKTSRIGKYKSDSKRPIKVSFKSPETAKTLLKSRAELKTDDINIYSDQTLNQQTYYKNLKNELERRTSNGEQHLRIKYIKGIPQIITDIPKSYEITTIVTQISTEDITYQVTAQRQDKKP